jgi:hypothetical protein
MANVVYCSTNILFNNNYYSAPATPYSYNPTHLPLDQTGIADSGASSFYFSSSAPVANLNPKAPTVCVRVANGLPERSVVSTTLALVPSLPPTAMQGHVMLSFPHTLIGLGPFADLGYTITFTKTGDFVVDHTDGCCVLKSWREMTGPRLWHFPFTAATPSPPGKQKNVFHSQDTVPRASAPMYHNLQPSQGIHAFGPQGKACSVLYLYGATQAMALAANSSSMTFDPRSMDLPIISALVGFYHDCLGFPAKQT